MTLPSVSLARGALAGWPSWGRGRFVPALAAGLAAVSLSVIGGRLGWMDMPLMAGCGSDMLQANLLMASRIAAVMTVIGITTACPRLLCSWQGLARLGLWLLGLALFTLLDMQAVTTALSWTNPQAALLLRSAPLVAGLALSACVPRGERACAAGMLVMLHAGLMSWPWMGACAALTAWMDARSLRRPSGLRRAALPSLSSATPHAQGSSPHTGDAAPMFNSTDSVKRLGYRLNRRGCA